MGFLEKIVDKIYDAAHDGIKLWIWLSAFTFIVTTVVGIVKHFPWWYFLVQIVIDMTLAYTLLLQLLLLIALILSGIVSLFNTPKKFFRDWGEFLGNIFAFAVIIGLVVLLFFGITNHKSKSVETKRHADKKHGVMMLTNPPKKKVKEEGAPPGMVYICTGPNAERYHNRRGCRGLGSCSDDIILVDEDDALDDGRSPCGICY